MVEIQNIFNAHGGQYRKTHKLSYTQDKAMTAISTCRTAKLGGHLDNCPNCGDTKPCYNSCRNRSCPKCQTLTSERWIDARKADFLNVGYFHVVFTLPHELSSIIYANQRACYNLLFSSMA